jgi:hypothetical protein
MNNPRQLRTRDHPENYELLSTNAAALPLHRLWELLQRRP